ncbi:hypothetical protein [Streptomyces sp. NBC_01262]|uniref:hypothetical protein n=1 Tax=Streptomyces sp. NBC_01262 TaxID=2903803 RepID=UPI002E381498|nr:hypothetical protein [Streptomyces sp. NBC_01262]
MTAYQRLHAALTVLHRPTDADRLIADRDAEQLHEAAAVAAGMRCFERRLSASLSAAQVSENVGKLAVAAELCRRANELAGGKDTEGSSTITAVNGESTQTSTPAAEWVVEARIAAQGWRTVSGPHDRDTAEKSRAEYEYWYPRGHVRLTPSGHDTGPGSELERLRLWAERREARDDEIRTALAALDLRRDTEQAWALGMTVLAHLDGPLAPGVTVDHRITGLRTLIASLRERLRTAGGDVPQCAACGCTEDTACPGGCHWQPTTRMEDLCSACVDVHGLCVTPGCGTPAADTDANDPSIHSWLLLQIAGVAIPSRWVCSPWCHTDRTAAAALEIAAADHAAVTTDAAALTMTGCPCSPDAKWPCGHCRHDECQDCHRCAGPGCAGTSRACTCVTTTAVTA